MLNPETIRLEDYSYLLPEDRIAQIPLEKRDNAKLLHYKNSNISHQNFYDLADFLPENSLLVFNNTKVIPARLFFQKASKDSNKENQGAIRFETRENSRNKRVFLNLRNKRIQGCGIVFGAPKLDAKKLTASGWEVG